MSKYKIAIIGSGNREHAIADKLSENLENIVYVYPGNPGMKYISTYLNVIDTLDLDNKTNYNSFVNELKKVLHSNTSIVEKTDSNP